MNEIPRKIHNSLVIVIVMISLFSSLAVYSNAQTTEPTPTEQTPIVKQILELLFGKNSDKPEGVEIPPEIQDVINKLSGTEIPDRSPVPFLDQDEVYKGPLPTNNYQTYNLSKPDDLIVQNFLSTIKAEPAKTWARKCLYYEKVLGNKGAKVNYYLLCAWTWFEGALDPGAVNCKDNSTAEKRQSVAEFCSNSADRPGDKNSMLQVGGYQAFDQAVANNYNKYYEMCYGDDSKFNQILSTVYQNSSISVNPYWNYNKQETGLVAQYKNDIGSVKRSDAIASSKSELATDQKKQSYTLLLGKDPCVRVGLNVSATASLPTDIQTKGWAKYVRDSQALLAARVEALRLLDAELQKETFNNGGNGGGTAGTGASFSGDFGKKQFTHFCQCDPRWKSKGDDNVCQAGCGLNALAFVLTNLGCPTTPLEERAVFEPKIWSGSGMHQMIDALNSDWTKSRCNMNFKVASGNLAAKGAVDIPAADKYFHDQQYKGKCLIIGSQNSPYNHIFAIVDTDIASNKMDVRDSWRDQVCNPYSAPAINRIQSPNYANYYAYAFCKQ